MCGVFERDSVVLLHFVKECDIINDVDDGVDNDHGVLLFGVIIIIILALDIVTGVDRIAPPGDGCCSSTGW